MRLSARGRHLLYQCALVAVIGIICWFALTNLLHNLHSRAITIGFDYLRQEAGFDIAEKLLDYDASQTYARAFLVGLLNTLFVSLLAIIGASLLGLLLAVARLSSNWLLRSLSGVYIETIRNVPLLLQLLLWYGALTELLPAAEQAYQLGSVYLSQRGLVLPWPVWSGGWFISWPVLGGFNFEGGKTISPEFAALCFGLSIYAASFIAEIIRGGILAIGRGQTDAAQALGLTRRQTLRLIVLPQALRVIIPPLTSQYLNLIKNSSLAVAIGYPDLVSISSTTLNQTGQAIEAMGLMMLVYLLISLLISALMNWLNQHAQMAGD